MKLHSKYSVEMGYRRSPLERLVSDIMRLIGSVTHWSFRALIPSLLGCFNIEIGEEFNRFLSYVATGALLAGLGVWGYLWWWPWTWFH